MEVTKDFELLTTLAEIEDPRRVKSTVHNLVDILFTALCGAIAGCDTWPEIVEFAEHRLKWLRRFIDLKAGVPTDDTFRRVFAALDTGRFAGSLLAWMQQLQKATKGRVIAIDGKTLRNSFDDATGKKALLAGGRHGWTSARERQSSMAVIAPDAPKPANAPTGNDQTEAANAANVPPGMDRPEGLKPANAPPGIDGAKGSNAAKAPPGIFGEQPAKSANLLTGAEWSELAKKRKRRTHVFRMVLSHSRKAYSEAVYQQTPRASFAAWRMRSGTLAAFQRPSFPTTLRQRCKRRTGLIRRSIRSCSRSVLTTELSCCRPNHELQDTKGKSKAALAMSRVMA